MGYRVAGHRARRRPGARALGAALCALAVTVVAAPPVLAADAGSGAGPDARVRAADTDDDPTRSLNNGECNPPAEPIAGTPWALQRLLLEQMWEDTKGKGVTVAVIDSGVDNQNPQLKGNVLKGRDLIDKKGDGTFDEAGHGTKVAGIIAGRPIAGTGFVGIAPEAKILPIRQNDDRNSGKVGTLVTAIRHAIAQDVDIINISQGTSMGLRPDSPLHAAIADAQKKDILVVASAGNDGADGQVKPTFPASIDGVLGVGASDRNNERAPFSQSGPQVDVAAPGVDMVSTVPGSGHCVDHGTSFAAPYAAGAAALVRAKFPEWSYEQVSWHLQKTADRVALERDQFVGWGVVDPVAAVQYDGAPPAGEPEPDEPQAAGIDADSIVPAPLILGETPQERRVRYGLYIFTGGALGVAVVIGTSIALRDWRRKAATLQGETTHG